MQAVEEVEFHFPEPTTENVHGVHKAQWREWGDLGHRVFNQLYESMRESQYAYNHPQQQPIPPEHWNTVCWNAAWQAANAAEQK